MRAVHFILRITGYLLLSPWFVIKVIAFVVFVVSLAVLGLLFVMVTFDLESIQRLYKLYLKKEFKTLVDGF
ncbi:hypothetical protein [Aquimarina latercula]|uniref:hypothetical protein n=1 Tax=Aquimarina latercula TaxID=987 RepID=UPI000482F2C5|nr:hypothetical protein [Aquimarina latercula]